RSRITSVNMVGATARCLCRWHMPPATLRRILAKPWWSLVAPLGDEIACRATVEQKAHFFALDLPHSDACFVRAYPSAVSEAWVDGHVHAFAFFGRVPQSVLYDNDRCLPLGHVNMPC